MKLASVFCELANPHSPKSVTAYHAGFCLNPVDAIQNFEILASIIAAASSQTAENFLFEHHTGSKPGFNLQDIPRRDQQKSFYSSHIIFTDACHSTTAKPICWLLCESGAR